MVMSAHISLNIFICFKKKNNPKHKIIFKDIPYSSSSPGEDSLYPPAGKRKQRELPPGCWWERLRRKEHRNWQGLEGRICKCRKTC